MISDWLIVLGAVVGLAAWLWALLGRAWHEHHMLGVRPHLRWMVFIVAALLACAVAWAWRLYTVAGVR